MQAAAELELRPRRIDSIGGWHRLISSSCGPPRAERSSGLSPSQTSRFA
jgi:hypothetical protein